jgi:hypothetical protein
MSGAYNACWYFGAIGNAWTVFGVYHDSSVQWTWRLVPEDKDSGWWELTGNQRIPIIIQAIAPVLQLIFVW